jgi:glycolate oxidase iron-sulfur subunit
VCSWGNCPSEVANQFNKICRAGSSAHLYKLRAMSHNAPISLHTKTPEQVHAHLDHDRLMDCVHCGLCLSQCPTYAELSLEADSPRGRIYLMRAVAEGRSELNAGVVEHLDACLGCRACETACPSGVQYGHLIEGARALIREKYQRPRKDTLIMRAIEGTFPYPNRLEAALLPLRVLRRSGAMKLLHKSRVMKALKLDDLEQLLPPLPPMQKRLNFPERFQARGEKQASVGMITGCVMQVMQSPINSATARVLCKAGCDVHAPKTQGCCGALHAHSGAIEDAKKLARQNIQAFENWQLEHGELDAIIINAAGCGAALKEYAGWFKGDALWEDRARKFSSKVKDVSEFLAQSQYKARLQALIKKRPQKSNTKPLSINARDVMPNTGGLATLKGVGKSVEKPSANQIAALENATSQNPLTTHHSPTITYHDACHLAHGQGVRVQPRELLAMIGETPLSPLAESEMCCGSAGVYNLTQPEMAMRLLERKMKNIKASGAKIVVTGNPGCMMQIMLGAKKFDVPIEVKHPMELLDEATGNA